MSLEKGHPLLSKIRRIIYEDINGSRRNRDLNQLYFDMLTNEVANDYAVQLKSEAHDQTKFQELMDQHQVIKNEKSVPNQQHTSYNLMHVTLQFEEDILIDETLIMGKLYSLFFILFILFIYYLILCLYVMFICYVRVFSAGQLFVDGV